MNTRLFLVYADGYAAATLLRPRRERYAFVAPLYPFYIKSEVQLIYVQLNVNYRRAQVAVRHMAIMNLIYLLFLMMRSRQDGGGGSKGSGSAHSYPQTDGKKLDTMAKLLEH